MYISDFSAQLSEKVYEQIFFLDVLSKQDCVCVLQNLIRNVNLGSKSFKFPVAALASYFIRGRNIKGK